MECPTCFRKLVVPQASNGGSSNLLLTASEVSTRPTQTSVVEDFGPGRKKQFPFAGVAFVIALLAVAGGAYFFRDSLIAAFRRNNPPLTTNATPKVVHKVIAPFANGDHWTLHLAGVKIPETPAAGRIHGEDFLVQRTTLQGGTLNFRQRPPELGLTVNLFANRGEDLSGQTIQIEAGRTNSPRVVLRWKNGEDQPETKNFRAGYALRLEFGQVSGTHLPGRIYLCTPDEAKSYVAGTFSAEIRKPPPPSTTSTLPKSQ